MSCTVTVSADGGRTCVVDADVNDVIEDALMVLIEVELAIPIHQQRLFLGATPLNSKVSLRANGIMGPAVSLTLRNVSTSAPQDASRLIEQLFTGGASGQPQSSPAGSTGGAPMVPSQQQATDMISQLFAGGGGAPQQPVQPQLDENDPEVQKKLMEAIAQQNIMQNMEQAIEYTPEAFGRVVMLYVPSTVDNVPVTAFIDSGAQMTIMNEATAERCGILRLLDRRMAGVAKGVGTSKILGRIHMAMVNLGGTVLPMSITVLESQDMEFLIGLDQLRRHQMSIDLKDNALKIPSPAEGGKDVALPFLGEGELPENLRKEDHGTKDDNDNEGGKAANSDGAPAPAAAASPNAQGEKQLTTEQQDKIKRLQELSGADAATVAGALEAAGWREDEAAAFLFE